jgi:aspartate/methionine/tyrosine aminotransferase
VVSALNELPGIHCPVPDASFYAFPDVRGTGMTAQQFTDHLIENYSVGVVAGTAFGDRGEGHVRITYAVPDDVLDEGLDRIRRAVERS